MLQLQSPGYRLRFRASEVAHVVVQERDREAQRPDQGPEDPEIARD